MTLGRIDSRRSPLLAEVLGAKEKPCAEAYITEGAKFVLDLLPENVVTVFTTDVGKYAASLEKFDSVYEISASVADKLSSARSGQEIIALCKKKNPPLPHLLVLLDDVQDSGNVGTIIRTASAFDFGVICSESSANPFSVKTVRSTAGAIAGCYVERTELESFVTRLKAGGYRVFSTELDKTASLLQNVTAPEKFAVVIGNEGSGVSKQISCISDEKIYIPIKRENSLNASVAASITMYALGK